MVAVIAGDGLGLLGTSLQQLGMGLGGNSGLGRGGASQYVNVATGNLVLQSQDEQLVANGLWSGLVRTYNSLGQTGTWSQNLGSHLDNPTGSVNAAGSSLTRYAGDGSEEIFTYDVARGLYVATNDAGAEDTIVFDVQDRTATFIAGNTRMEEIYGAVNGTLGVLTGLVDGETGASYTLSYDANTITVTSSNGEAIEAAYDAGGRIVSLSTLEIPPGGGSAELKSRIGYGYDTSGRLISVTTDLTPNDTSDSSTFTTTYTYDGGTTRIASVTQGDGRVVSYTYDASNRIHSVTTGSGADAQTLTFAYDSAAGTTTVTDASGRAWAYAYDADGNLASVTSPPVNGQYQVTSYTYTTDGHLASVTDPEGHITVYEYDDHGNRVLERDADGNTTTWTYNADDQALTRTVYRVPDPMGSDPGNLGLPSDPSTTWYVYDDGSDGLGNADQLRYVIDADGDVSETQYNSGGQVGVTRRFAGEAYDTSGIDPDTAPTIAAMNTWAATQDLTQTTRVDYTYDPLSGRLAAKTAWDQVDGSGNGVADVGESITQYVYDAQGLLRQQITERGANRTILESTSYSYDGLGRLIGSTDALGHVTTYAYAVGGTLTVTYANGLVHTEVRNSAGELVTVTESVSDGPSARTTHYFYDTDGHLRATEAPDGAISYTFYDASGRINGTVDAMGAVTQYVRDADGNVVETRQYASTVSTTNWLTNGAVTVADDITQVTASLASTSDRITLSLYDDANLHVADVDAEGHVTTYGYDGAGNRTSLTQYATALSAAQLSALQGAPGWSTLHGDLDSITSAADRVTRTFYDVANRAVAMLDAAGYLATTAYDAAGRIVKTTAYASLPDLSGAGDPPTLDDVLHGIQYGDGDQTTRHYYDDRGRSIAEVDAEGYLTTTTYDETEHTAASTRYTLAISTTLTGHETLADLTGDVAGSASQTSIQQYDADGNLVCATAVDGAVTTYAYDAAGNLVGTTTTPPSGAGTARSASATYDVFGDELTATNGVGAITKNVYNALGQKVQTTDGLGNSTWYFYDADGRLVYTVKGIASGTTKNALGEVTAYAYDAFGEVASTTRYAGRLNLSALELTSSTSLAALGTAIQAIANPAVDAASSYTYTLNGLTASIKDGLGYTTANTYDAFGDLTSVQQQLSGAGQTLGAGNSTKTTYTYDARGERIGEVDDAGGLNRTIGVTYDAFGRVVSRTDGNGNVTSYDYDKLGRQISVSETVQGAVRTAQTIYDAYNRIVSQTDAMNNKTVYQYSPDTRAVTVTTPDGVKLTTVRDAYGDTLSVTDTSGNATHYTYDGDGRLLTTTDALSHTTTDAYDNDGNLFSTTDANGVVTAYTYDAAGRVLTRVVDQGDSSHLNLATTYAYDGRGQQVSVTDPRGVVTTYVYDADGNTTKVVEDAGSGKLNLITTYTWDGAGHELTVVQDPGSTGHLNRTTQYSYDDLGRLIEAQVDPAGLNLRTTYSYDANDNLIAKVDPNGNATASPDDNITRYVYDEANEQVYVIDAGGGVTRTWYDADGRVTSTRRYATALATTDLNGLGASPSIQQVDDLVVADADDDQVSYSVYNDDGQQAYTIDPLGNVTETRYDAAGRVSETLAYADAIPVTASLASELQQGTAFHDMASAVSTAGNSDRNAEATLNLYDDGGELRFVVRQDTVDGQLIGIVSERRYDADGRIIASIDYGTTLVLNGSESLDDQFSTASVQQALASAADRHLTQYVHDNAGRLRFTIDATNHVIEQQYDADGNLTKTLTYLNAITVPASPTPANVEAAVSASNNLASTRFTSAVYDHAGRVVQTGDSLSDANAKYTYDALGEKTSYKNWDEIDQDEIGWTYAYDKAGRLVTQTSPVVDSAAIVTKFTYDANGNVLSKIEADGTSIARTTNYAYDSRGNQTKITYPGGTYASMTYDALGHEVVNRDVNGNHEYKVYNAANELAYDVDGNGYVTAYAYDAYGNQTQVTRYATALSTMLTGAGQPLGLDQVQQAISISSSDRTLTTTYDQLNRKVMVEQPAIAFVSDTGAAGTGNASPTTTYTYDAYGNVVATSVLVASAVSGESSPTWATTYDYYNALGQKTLEVTPAGAAGDAKGYVTTWAYDAQGNVTRTIQYATSISTSGLSTATPPTLNGLVSGSDRTTTYTYDTIGRKASETDTGDYSSYVNQAQSIATGTRITGWTYDGEDRVTSVTVNGATTSTVYDALGRVTQVTQPARLVLAYVSSTQNWQTALEGSTPLDLSDTTNHNLYVTASPVTTFTYDALGEVLSSTTSTGGAAGGEQSTSSHYDALGRVTSETDADGTKYTNTYDAAGNLKSTTYVLTRNGGSSTVTTTYTYDADNQRLSAVTKRGSTTESSTYVKYNAFGEVIAKGDGPDYGGYELSYQYDDAGNLIAATDPKTGAQHSYQYDLRGNLVYDTSAVTGGATAYVENHYDLAGRLVSQMAPSSTSTTGEGSAVMHAYDRWGNVIGTTDARGYVTTYIYDSQNHLIKQTEPEVLVTAEDGTRTWQTPTKEWYYDVNGNALGVTDENGNTTLNSYDAAGELTATTDALGAVTLYAYDGLGNQVAKQTPVSAATEASPAISHITWSDVDALGRVIAQGDFLLEGSTLSKETQQKYGLDENGNRINVTDALGKKSYYAYDSQGRLLSSQTPMQHQASINGSFVGDTYTYDLNGNKTGETTADKNSNGQFDVESWSYDYYGRVLTHVDLSGASYHYYYDLASGLLTSETSTWDPSSLDQQANPQSDPSYVPGADEAPGGTGVQSTETYTYYADGQVKQITQKTGSQTTTTTSYEYDDAGNETDEQVQTVDGAGDAVDTDTQTRYDSHNRISEVTELDSDTGTDAGIMRTAYNYDAVGNRRAVFVQSGYGGSSINPGEGGPTASAIATQTVQPGTSWSLDVAPHFTDTLGFGLTFTATLADGSALPGWMHMTSSGVLRGTAQASSGQWTVKIAGTDVGGNSASTTVTVTVPVVNPVFGSGLSNQIAAVGQAFSFTQPLATDANGSAITYVGSLSSGAALPSWLHFDPATATFTGTPLASSTGTYTLEVTAHAANGGHAEETFTFTVMAAPPVFNGSIANQTLYPGRTFSFSFPTSLFTTPDGEPLTFGAGTWEMVYEPEANLTYEKREPLPSWMHFYYSNSLVVFTGTPPGDTPVGTVYQLYVSGSNADGQGSGEAHFTATTAVYAQPVPVYHGGLTDQTGVIGGSSLDITLPSGAFTEPDGGALTYTAQVLIPEHTEMQPVAGGQEVVEVDIPAEWVALSGVGLSINATSGTITGVPTALAYSVSTVGAGRLRYDTAYDIKIIATNGQSGTAAGTFTLTNTYAPPEVLNPIPNPPAQDPNSSIRIVQSNTFSDPAGYGLSYSVTLSNGAALPSGLTWDDVSYTLHVGTIAAGSYSIKVTATDQGSASDTFTLTVKNVPPTLYAPVNLTLVKGTAMTAYTAPIARDPNGDAVTYSVSNLPPGIHFSTSTHTFSGTPTSTGSWTVTYKATDSHGAATSTTFTMKVNAPAPQPPVYNGGIPDTVLLRPAYGGTAVYTFPSTAFSSPAGETLHYSAVMSGSQHALVTFNSATRTFTAQSYPNGDYDVSVVLYATDTGGRSVSHSFQFAVVTKPPPGGGGGNPRVIGGPGLETSDAMAAQQAGQSGTPNIQSYWFTYDADNRVDISGGDLVEGQIQFVDRTGSVENQYNLAGEVVTQLSNNGAQRTQTYRYDARGEQISSTLIGGQVETKQYDPDGRLVADVYQYSPDTPPIMVSGTRDGTVPLPIAGWLSSATTYYYNDDGEVTRTFQYGRDMGDPNYWTDVYNEIDSGQRTRLSEKAVPPDLPTLGNADSGYGGDPGTGYPALTMRSKATYGSGSYDAEGNVKSYTYSGYDYQDNLQATTYQVQYLKKDGYLEKSTTGSGTGQLTTTDTSVYDAFGRRIDIVSHAAGQGTDQVRAFAYDAEGEILQRRDGSATGSTFTVYDTGGYAIHHYAYADGQQVGNVDEHGTIDVLSGVTGFSNTEQGTSDYVAQAGDSMEIIAQRVYGDTSLWYVVADANGFDEASDVPAAGQILKLPEVTTNSNTAETFKPYNPRQISGSTTPSLPQAPMPAPSAHHCSTLAQIVVIAVVIVVSIYTAGAASEAFAGTLSTSTAGETFAAGASVLGGGAGLSGATLASAAIGGAAGNAAGQLVGDAEGVHQGFSWGEVASAGLTAGATAGVGGALSEASISGAEAAAIQGAAGYAGQTIAGKLTGQPTQFSWANLVADAVGSAITAKVGLPNNTQLQQGESSGHFFEDLGGGLLNGAIDSETARLLGGDAANGNQIAIDAFGNALGNAAVGAINEAEWKAAQPSINKQVNAAIDNIMGDGGSTGTVLPAGYGQAWENGTLFGNAALGRVARSTEGSAAAGDYSMIVTGDPSKGYPVPVNYTNDPAVIKALYANTVAYVNYENKQPLNYLPSVPEPDDPQALIDYNHALQHGLYPEDYLQTLDTVNVVATRGSADVAPPYWVSKGYFASTYDTAVEGASDSRNTLLQQVVFGTLAIAEAPLMLAEETGRGVLNAPAQAAIAFQAFRGASTATDSYQRWNEIAQGLGAGGQAILGAIPAAGTIEGAVARSMLRTDAGVVVSDVASINTVDAARITPTAADSAARLQPQGLTTSPLAFADGVKLVRAFEAQGFNSTEAALKAADLIGTGSTLPVATPLDTTDALFKFVPKGAGVGPNTPFFTTSEQAAFYSENPELIGDAFGLPLKSQASEYDVYMVRPIDGAVVYESRVAPTVQKTWQQSGGAIQRLIIDRGQFTVPVKVNTVKVPEW